MVSTISAIIKNSLHECEWIVALLVLLNVDQPLSQNPMFEEQNGTTLIAKWSPPFLWPGYRIAHYTLSVRNHDTNAITFHTRNASFDDVIVSFELSEEQNQNCTEYMVGISAITESGMELNTQYINGGYSICKCILWLGYLHYSSCIYFVVIYSNIQFLLHTETLTLNCQSETDKLFVIAESFNDYHLPCRP